MAVMDLVPPPVAMMAISGTWERTDADCWGAAGWGTWTDRRLGRTVEEGELATDSRERDTE